MHWRNREIPKAFTQKGEVKQDAVEGHDDPSFRQCPSECGFVASSYVDIILRAGAPADERHLVVVDAESGRLDVQKNRFRGEAKRDPIVLSARQTFSEETNTTVPQGSSRRLQGGE